MTMSTEEFYINGQCVDPSEFYTPAEMPVDPSLECNDGYCGLPSHSQDSFVKITPQSPSHLGRNLAIAGGTAVVVAGVIFVPEVTIPALLLGVAGCGSSPDHPDTPMPFPQGGDQNRANEQDENREEEESVRPGNTNQPPQENPPAEECVPDLCEDGVIDDDRSDGEHAPCIAFEEVHVEEGLVSSMPHNSFSIADFNSDGSPDIFILNDGSPNKVFRRDTENYTEVSAEAGLNFGGDSQDAAWADYDGDGDRDLLLVGTDGSELYQNDSGRFTLLADPLGIHDPSPGKKALWISGGFLLGTEDGTWFYHYEGENRFQEMSRTVGLDDPGDAVAIEPADYDGDGDQDIYIANTVPPNRLFQNQGDHFTPAGIIDMPTDSCPTDAAWVRTAPDLLPSLYVPNYCGGNSFLINQQDSTFVERAGALGVRDPGQTTTVAAGDISGDGKPALFLGRWQQENLVYIPRADGTGYSEAATPLGMATNGMTVGAQWFDYDNDGKLDLLVMMADGTLELHRNTSRTVRVCP